MGRFQWLRDLQLNQYIISDHYKSVVGTEPTGHPCQDIFLRFLPPSPRGSAALPLLGLGHRVVNHELPQPLDALRVRHSFHRLSPPLLHILRLGSAPASLQKALVLCHIVEALDVWNRKLDGWRVQGQQRVKAIGADI